MSAPVDTMSEPVKQEETKSIMKKQQSYRQKMQAVQARMKYREKLIKGFRQHLQKGTFPKRFKSLKPYPKMSTPESQAIVNAACQQVECVILDQMIQEEEIKLKQDQSLCQTLKEERNPAKTSKKSMSMVQLKQELKELQTKYSELCRKLDSTIEL